MVHISTKPGAKPCVQPARKLPLAYEGIVEDEIRRLLELDIIEPVGEYSKFQSPLVIVPKKNGKFRMCVDMRLVNREVLKDTHPFPSFEMISAKLAGSTHFSKIDLKDAFYHVMLDNDSREITTFTTHLGLFRFKRLVMGLCAAPEIFQRIMENMLRDLSGHIVLADDILTHGPDKMSESMRSDAVLRRLKENNLELNTEKCEFSKTELSFLGHVISAKGLRPAPDKITAIHTCLPPKSASELRSFLGLVSYVGSRSIQDLARITEPLRELTHKNSVFYWEKKHQDAFERLKEETSRLPTLGYFSVNMRTRLYADAGPGALGAVLVQEDDMGQKHLVACASNSD